jgi:hypothetical protein
MSKDIRDRIISMVEERAERPVDPAEIARSLVGSDEKQWRLVMTPIRREAIKLAEKGRVVLLRKGRQIDPADLRGVYRIASAAGAGKSASVLPVNQ